MSLATGTRRSWAPVDSGGVAPLSLSWAGDRTLAFEWTPGNNRHPPGIGIRVLNVRAPGNLLQASRHGHPLVRLVAGTARPRGQSQVWSAAGLCQ